MNQTEALLVTLSIEVPIAVALAVWRGWVAGRLGTVALSSLAASLLTHPLLWIVDPRLKTSFDTPMRWALLETAIALVEAGVYVVGAGLTARRAIVTSFLANAASFGIGVAIYAWA